MEMFGNGTMKTPCNHSKCKRKRKAQISLKNRRVGSWPLFAIRSCTGNSVDRGIDLIHLLLPERTAFIPPFSVISRGLQDGRLYLVIQQISYSLPVTLCVAFLPMRFRFLRRISSCKSLHLENLRLWLLKTWFQFLILISACWRTWRGFCVTLLEGSVWFQRERGL